jgi:hypothetical protein
MTTTVIYSKRKYTLVGKTKLCYGMNLDFYDLDFNDLNKLELYENQTVRFEKNWYIVKSSKVNFYSVDEMDKFPRYWIKKPYKKPEPIKN